MIALDASADLWRIGAEGGKFGIAPMSFMLFETSWLPLVGPTVMSLTRYIAKRLLVEGPFRIEPFELAYAIGTCKPGAHAPFVKALVRAEKHEFIRIDTPEHFTLLPVAPHVGPCEGHKNENRARWNAGLAEKAGTQL